MKTLLQSVVVTATIAASTFSYADPQIDQSQTSVNTGIPFRFPNATNMPLGQSFTAGLNGLFVGITFQTNGMVQGGSNTLTYNLFKGDGVNGRILATGSATVTYNGTSDLKIDTSLLRVNLVNSQKYTFVVTGVTGQGDLDERGLVGSNVNPYGGGRIYTGPGYGDQPNWDLAFRTTVDTSPPSGTPDPAGPGGAQGPSGPKGATGSAGPTGEKGADGRAGATGATGANGIAGTVGKSGAAGTAGSPGVAGATGSTGAVGKTGVTGLTGAAGPAGAAGARGMPGSSGTGSGAIRWVLLPGPFKDFNEAYGQCFKMAGDAETYWNVPTISILDTLLHSYHASEVFNNPMQARVIPSITVQTDKSGSTSYLAFDLARGGIVAYSNQPVAAICVAERK